jgi:hypothetical protein
MAKPKTKTEEGGFNALSSSNKDWVKQLETKGWLFLYDAGDWSAKKGALDVGPVDSFMVMMNLVETEEKKISGATVKVDTEANGQARLPGQEAEIVPEIVDCAKRRIAAVAEFKKWQQDVTNLNAEAQNLAEKYPAAFLVDKATGTKTYTGGGVELEIEHETKDKVHARFVDNEPAAKKSKAKGK